MNPIMFGIGIKHKHWTSAVPHIKDRLRSGHVFCKLIKLGKNGDGT